MGPNGHIPARYEPGLAVTGYVRDVRPFGIFVELEPGVIAICTLPQLKRLGRGVLPSEVYSPGEQVQVRLHVVDRENGQIGASEIGVGMSNDDSEHGTTGRLK